MAEIATIGPPARPGCGQGSARGRGEPAETSGATNGRARRPASHGKMQPPKQYQADHEHLGQQHRRISAKSGLSVGPEDVAVSQTNRRAADDQLPRARAAAFVPASWSARR